MVRMDCNGAEGVFKRTGLTFDADNMVPDLLSQDWVWDGLDEVVYGVDGRVDALKPLDLLPDGQRIVPIRLGLIERPVDAAHS